MFPPYAFIIILSLHNNITTLLLIQLSCCLFWYSCVPYSFRHYTNAAYFPLNMSDYQSRATCVSRYRYSVPCQHF